MSSLRIIELVEMLLCYTSNLESLHFFFLFCLNVVALSFVCSCVCALSWIKCMQEKWNTLALFNNVCEFNFALKKFASCCKQNYRQ